jgi:hypothetical protein
VEEKAGGIWNWELGKTELVLQWSAPSSSLNVLRSEWLVQRLIPLVVL